jgi:hypothetical protein
LIRRPNAKYIFSELFLGGVWEEKKMAMTIYVFCCAGMISVGWWVRETPTHFRPITRYALRRLAVGVAPFAIGFIDGLVNGLGGWASLGLLASLALGLLHRWAIPALGRGIMATGRFFIHHLVRFSRSEMVDNFLGAAGVAAGLLALFKWAPQVAEALIVLAVCGLLLHAFWRRNFPSKKEKKGR